MKLTKGRLVIMAALLLILATITGLVAVTLVQAADFREENIQKVWLNGVYSADGSDWRETVPGKMTNVRFHRATIRGRLSQEIVPGQKLVVVSNNVWYELYAEAYGGTNRRADDVSRLKDTPGSAVRFFESDDLNGEITLELSYPYTPFSNRDLSDLLNLYVSDDNGMFSLIIRHKLLLLTIAVTIGFFGLLAFPIAGVVLGGINIRYLAFSLLSVVTGVHLVFKILYPYLPLWIDDPVLCMSLGEATVHIFCISVLVFLRVSFRDPIHNRIGNVVLAGYSAVVIMIFLFSLTGFRDLYACKPISHLTFTVGAVALGICMFREIKTNRDAVHTLCTLVPITAAMVFDALNAYLGFVNLSLLEWGTALALLYQIVTLVIDLRKQYKETLRYQEMQRELYESRVAIMVSQIQPHFLYNSLTSIAMMCSIDPETAQEATITFADYLRGNMDSLKQKTPVPFERELEHLKKYLYIEKLRFGDDLNIAYDIQATDFVLPQLSIQPLVENAVKHGVGMKREGGTVTIATRETADAFEIIISDDGVGFDAEAVKDDGRSHIGMDNVRRRLREMCGGEVVITSTVGKGTTATVILPKEHNRTSAQTDSQITEVNHAHTLR